MIDFFVSCPFGLSNILNKELKKIGYPSHDTFETGTYIFGNLETMYRINLRSRIANKVYIVAKTKIVLTFDDIFDLVSEIDWKQYVRQGQGVDIVVQTKDSQLDSTKTLQSICQKAIFQNIAPNQHWDIDQNILPLQIMVVLKKNKAKIMINTSGEALFKRGYRTHAGDAPLKENLAAAIVLLANWSFGEPLHDPFCGSGTILIEAAMIAKNIAPGLRRNFAFEWFQNFDTKLRADIRQEAQQKIFEKTYRIFGYDQDLKMIKIAETNAKQAGIDDTITFQNKTFAGQQDFSGWIISNPPYGKRLSSQLDHIYQDLLKTFDYSDNKGAIITSYDWKVGKERTKKKIYNGNEECNMFLKK